MAERHSEALIGNRFGVRAETMNQRWNYTQGLKDVGNGLFAYLQPDGGWGWSNDQGKLAERVNPLELFALMSEVRDRQRSAVQAKKP